MTCPAWFNAMRPDRSDDRKGCRMTDTPISAGNIARTSRFTPQTEWFAPAGVSHD